MVIYFSLLSRHLINIDERVPVKTGNFLGGSESVWELGLVAHEVEDLADVVVFDKVVGGGHDLSY